MNEHRSPETGEVVVRDPTPDLMAALKALETLGDEAIDETLPMVGLAVLGEAQIAAPVATGFLKSQHTLGPYHRETKQVELRVNAAYALARHERWPSLPGYQWFRGTIIGKAPGIMQRAVARMMAKALDKAREAGRGGAP